jgi:hypothetical protein
VDQAEDVGYRVAARSWEAWLPPLIATMGSQLFVWLMALLAGVDPLRLASGLKWDALRYLDIARRGYEIYPCGGGLIDFPAPPPDA